MASYQKSNQLFINPYNFVPVNLNQTPRSDITQPQKNLLTGYLDCRIRCRTPLAVPDVSRRKEIGEEHFSYPFFTIDGVTPMIPGSAIRGVIRAVYETLTDSCFGSMQADTKITVRNNGAFHPGLLIRRVVNSKETWELHEAERRLIVTDGRFYDTQHLKQLGVTLYKEHELRYKTGDKVEFELVCRDGKATGYSVRKYEVGKYANIVSGGGHSGYICIGEKIPNRHFQSIFEDKRPVGRVTQDDFARLEAVLKVYRDSSINRKYQNGHNGYKDYEYAKAKGIIPVYYSQDGRIRYMSFASIGRKAFAYTLNDKAGEKSHQACDSRKNLCPACALFGTVEGEAAGSKIRFTDAKCCNFEPELLRREITFEELGSPRMSYLPFYLRANKLKASFAQGYDSRMLEIRGRKYYWHHIPDMDKRVVRNNRNATFDVVKQGAEFKFRIYFDGVTEHQLELIAAAVHLNENTIDGHYCHKLGHGKPLGYGSVKIAIDQCKIRNYTDPDGMDTWSETQYPIRAQEQCYDCEKETYDALRVITDFNALKELPEDIVSYPKVLLDAEYEALRDKLRANTLASHKWFSDNYKLGSEGPKAALPEILDNDIRLSAVEATAIDSRRDLDSGNGGKYNRGNNRGNSKRDNERNNRRGSYKESNGRGGRH